MPRFIAAMRLCFVSAAVVCPLVVAAAERPTAAEILKIHHENKSRLSRLHLQLTHDYETTAARDRKAEQGADEKEEQIERLLRVSRGDASMEIEMNGKRLTPEDARKMLNDLVGPERLREIDSLRSGAKPFRTITPMEFFLDGENYQVRRPVHSLSTDQELEAWRFSVAPLTAATLLTDYRRASIFSRSAGSMPAGRSWWGNKKPYAYTTAMHLAEVTNIDLPPFTDITYPAGSRSGNRHPIDSFFSQPSESYHVLGQEKIDGRALTIVEVAVPSQSGSDSLVFYRAWLDLKRGALPMKMHQQQAIAATPKDLLDRLQPDEIMTTQRVVALPNGAFYPAKTVSQAWQVDPDAPRLSEAQWDEVRAGKRTPAMVVKATNTWDCSLVEAKTDFGKDFFVIAFPKGQHVDDFDAEEEPALDRKPPVEIGQEAPPLTIGRWLDGKELALDDLRGQVVVLDFWGLWCGGCVAEVPQQVALQERFRDQPVTFIAIHTADKDSETLAAKIEAFRKKNDWHWIAAIDAGRAIEDSLTTRDYGVLGFPLTVIIGTDGKIAYVDFMSDPPGDDQPRAQAELQKQMNDALKHRFESVGEAWPISEKLDEKARQAILDRVQRRFIIQQIESALGAKR